MDTNRLHYGQWLDQLSILRGHQPSVREAYMLSSMYLRGHSPAKVIELGFLAYPVATANDEPMAVALARVGGRS